MRGALEALREALRDTGAEHLVYVPGYPVTEIAEALNADIAVNEKVALESALGASATGTRSMVIVKQLGMNILADPLAIAASHTTGAGIVVLVGDDLGPRGSQIEMDSRYYGPLLELPVLDPSAPDIYNAIVEAFTISEQLSIPAIVRVTSDLLESGEDVHVHARKICNATRCFDRSIWDLTARGRQQRHRMMVMPALHDASEAAVRVELRGDTGIIASGSAASIAKRVAEETGSSMLLTLYAHPLPSRSIERFLSSHTSVLVVEGPRPFMESQLRARGKLSGHLPYAPPTEKDIRTALNLIHISDFSAVSGEPETAAGRTSRRTLCAGCPFMPLYNVLSRLEVPVAGDAGCTILSVRMGAVDMVYGLGSSIGVASGFKKKGIAIVGDYALAHSGLQGLINAIWHDRGVLVGVIDNGVAAMTGFQEVVDLEPVLRALLPDMKILPMPAPETEIEALLREELKRPGVSLIVFRGSCASG